MSSDSSLCAGFELHCLDVGQGCSTVVVLPSQDPASREAIVIDSSDSLTTINCLEQHSVHRLRLVLITHSDDDHARGIPAVLKQYRGRVSALAYNLDRSTLPNKVWQRHLLSVINSNAPSQIYRVVDDEDYADARSSVVANLLTLEGDKIGEVLYPLPEDVRAAASSDDPNHASAVVCLWLNGFKALLGSDLSLKGWSILYSRLDSSDRDKIKANLFQYPHHGANLSIQEAAFAYNGRSIQSLTPLQLVQIIDPDIVLVSVGTEQPPNYIHPRSSTFDLLSVFRNERALQGKTFRLACTQLTSRCFTSPLNLRPDALNWQQQSSCASDFSLRQTSSCPCAGTFSIYIPPDGKPYAIVPDVPHQEFISRMQSAGGTPGCRIQNLTVV